jgi:2-(1,2-epoxy-1,2-dihydrophenyl)acetyl-CoA isomerase
MGMIKWALNDSTTNTLGAQLALEATLQREAGRTADYKEGVKAFQEKRAAHFTGK